MDFSEFFNYTDAPGKRPDSDFIFLADLPADDWERILAVTQCHHFAAGDIVVRQGEMSRALYIVASGELEISLMDEAGECRQVSTIGPLSVFGEQAFLDSGSRSATVCARSAAQLHLLTPEAFDTLAARHPDLARQLLFELGRIVSLRLREMMALALQQSR